MIQLDVLGAPDLRIDGAQVRSVLAQPKRLALLTWLATSRPGGFESRDRLLAAFWPESDDERARNALRQSLHYLRRSLGADILVGRDDREVGLDADRLTCDAVTFDAHLAAGRFAEAVETYRGEFLAGVRVDDADEVERWIEERRAHFRRAAAGAALKAAEMEAERGSPRAAAQLARRALVVDPFDERALRRLVVFLDQGGERSAALEAYETFARRYGGELGLTPSEETRALVEALREGSGAGGLAGPVGPAAAVAPGAEPAAAAVTASGPPREDGTSAPPTAEGRPREPTPPRGRWGAAAVAGIVIVAGGALLSFLAMPERTPPGAREAAFPAVPADSLVASPPAIAVMPFMNLSGDPEREFFSDGMSEEVMAALGRVPGLRVVARTSAFSFKGQPVGIDSIARALRVGHVLEGSVRTSGDELRVTAKLVDARTGYQVWADTYQGPMTEAFTVQEAIAREIVSALEPRLADRMVPSRVTETHDPAAYADVLRGLAMLRLDAVHAFARADSLFRAALERDPEYGRAMAGLARVRVVDGYRRVGDPDGAYLEARSLAERALALDPGLSTAHVVLGRVAEEHDWDFGEAERHYRRAIALNPADEVPVTQLSRLLTHLGRVEEALRLAEEAVARDPLAPAAHRWQGVALTLSGRYEEALVPIDRALVIAPGHALANVVLAVTLVPLAREDEAVRAAEAALATAPGEPLMVATAAWVAGRAGNGARARALLASLEAAPRPAHYYRAMALAGLGDRAGTLGALERAVAEREVFLPQVGVHPAFTDLHNEPRFRDVLRRAGLADSLQKRR